MRDMSPVELAWVAGILEGEGCFFIAKTATPRVQVRCNMTDEDVIRRLHATIGAGRVTGPIHKLKPTKADGSFAKPQWLWVMGRKTGAEEFLGLIRPLMCERRSAKIGEILDALASCPPRAKWRHGTRQGYEVGCRCDECRGAHAARFRAIRAKNQKPQRPLRHGTRNAYERRSCRCDECCEFMASLRLLKRRHVVTTG